MCLARLCDTALSRAFLVVGGEPSLRKRLSLFGRAAWPQYLMSRCISGPKSACPHMACIRVLIWFLSRLIGCRPSDVPSRRDKLPFQEYHAQAHCKIAAILVTVYARLLKDLEEPGKV